MFLLLILKYFLPFSGVYITDFEQINISWGGVQFAKFQAARLQLIFHDIETFHKKRWEFLEYEREITA